MNLQVTDVEFDFFLDSSDKEVSEDYKKDMRNSFLGKVFDVETEDELSDIISDESGWCVISVDFEYMI